MYVTPYKRGTKRCDLYLTMKYVIVRSDLEHLLNKRTKIISRCEMLAYKQIFRNKC